MKFTKEEKKRFLIKMICTFIPVLIVIIFDAKFMPSEDFSVMLKWWFTLLLLSLSMLPLTTLVFHRFHNNGWIFSKPLAIAFSGWLFWYLSSMKLVKFTQVGCIIVSIIFLVLNYVIWFVTAGKRKKKIDYYEIFSADKIASMISTEAMFFCFFALMCYVKGYNAAAYGTERFMDYGFITAMLKSDYAPPHDMWLAGSKINYYYLGQYLSAFMIRFTGVGAGYGYNLMLITLPSLGFTMVYTLVYNIVNDICKVRAHEDKKEGFIPKIAGILGGAALVFAGNMHFPIYKWIVPKLKMILDEEAPAAYWFANATRYIGYDPDVEDKCIHECPSYSFVVGDLHAHVINIIFVVTVLAVLYAWMKSREKLIETNMRAEKIEKVRWIKEIFSPQILVCMFFIGLFHMTNYWDFPIYFVVCGAIIFFCNLKTFRYKKQAWILTGLMAVGFIITWIIVGLPFTLTFDSIASYVRFCDRHSRLYQLLILWGLPVFLVVTFLVKKIVDMVKAKGEDQKKDEEKAKRFIPGLFDSLASGELYTITLGLCAIGLVLMPEVIYVADIYGGAYQRTNTMFKLTYQSYIMFSICMAVIMVYLIYFKCGKILRQIGLLTLILFGCTVCYIFEACNTWFTGYYQTLDASGFLETENYDDYEGIEWVNENVGDEDIVLEMCGLSYSYFNRVSVFTGNPTVLGWQSHEWLWRSSGDKEYPQMMNERHDDVLKIYTSLDIEEVKSLVDKYNIDYIYVGEAEHYDGYFQMDETSLETGEGGNFHGSIYKRIAVNDALLKQLGTVHMISEITDEKPYETYVVEIQ